MMCEAAQVYIDVNGPKPPNTLGHDIFAFSVSEKGALYPFGSREVSQLHGGLGVWSDTSSVASCKKTDSAKYFGINDSTNRGIGCAGNIVQHNYRINYL